jgi:exodeoxyribonuclease-5
MNITNISQANCKDPVSISGFTDDQRKAYTSLIEFINQPYDVSDYKRALIGAAGTGKTYLVKALIKNCGISYSTIGLAAPTHKACRVLGESVGIPNVKINTLQSDLGLRLNFDVDKFDIDNPPFDPKGRIKIGDYRLYIVDESSMINRGLVMFLEKTCKSNRCKIIYIGDSSQLAPVNEKYSSAFRGIKTCFLKQVVRQGDDNPVSYLLDLLRYDIEHKTFNFLSYISNNRSRFNADNTKGYCVCTPVEFEKAVYTNFSDEELTSNIDYAKVIAYTNNSVSAWNKFIRNAIIKDADKSVITKNDLIISYVTIVNQFNECIIKNSEEYILKDVVNYTHPKYNLKGFMVRFTAIHGGSNTTPLFIIDHKDRFTINMYVKLSREMIQSAKAASLKIRAQRWKDYFTFKESCLLLTNIMNPTTGKIEFSRDLDYGFSLTSHKSQGSTFDTSLVDVNDIVFDKYGNPYTDAEEINRRLYVACSRCKNKLFLKYGK